MEQLPATENFTPNNVPVEFGNLGKNTEVPFVVSVIGLE